MNEQTTIRITLVVKGDREVAFVEVDRRVRPGLQSWFVEDLKAPFPIGSLLWYGIPEKDGEAEGLHFCSDCQDAESE